MTAPRVVVVGDLAVDVLVAPLAPPVPGADVPARIATTPGGAGANTAAWLAACGVAVTLVARVGDDPAGRAAVAGLAGAGVTPAVAVDPRAPTATVVVLGDGPRASGGPPPRGEAVDPGRTMFSDRGAAARLAPADLPPLDAAHLHLSGYVLHDPGSRPAGLAALAAARAAGATTSLDPQATGLLTAGLLRELGGIDLLLPNADELAALTAEPATLLDVVGAVAVTHGAGGASWVDRTGVVSVAAPEVDVVDPTGAGDAFDAGLLAAWLCGAAPRDALAAGCRAGAEAVSRPGARPVRRP
jgi:sugar/nucleoside kinase (ribokinase family)